MTRAGLRRGAARLVAGVILAGGLVPVLGGSAWACSCVGYSSEDEQYRQAARNSQVIYTGLVRERSQQTAAPSPEPQPPSDVRYTIDVEEALKGDANGTREISTADNSAACGIELTPGRRALLVEFAGDRRVGLCDGTTQERVDERAAIVRDELRRAPPSSPRPAPTSPPGGPSLPHTGAGRLAVAALAAALLAVAAMAGTRRTASSG